MTVRMAFNSIALERKIPQGDTLWMTYNDSFVNLELEVVDIANLIYAGRGYTAWHKGRRRAENFQCTQFFALDMDTGDERSSFAHLERHPFVSVYGGMMHSTASHTEEHPRTRVLFFLDTFIDTSEAAIAISRFLVSQFDGADTACTDASRFYYGAKGCHIWFTENVLPVATLRYYYQRWQATQKKQPQARPQTETRRELPKELADVESALRRINPMSIDYRQWIAILAALHDEYGDRALGLAVDWGQGKDGEIERKWRSFGNYSGNRAGLGTIFELAKTH